MIWKQITGWPYEISDTGSVRRIRGKVLTPMRMGQKRKQYSVVALCHGGGELRRKVHVLVLEAFVGPRPHGYLALHKDDDTTNNTLSNLYWGTHHQNADDARYRGGKLTSAQVRTIKAHPTAKGRVLARVFAVSEQFICDIRQGRSYP